VIAAAQWFPETVNHTAESFAIAALAFGLTLFVLGELCAQTEGAAGRLERELDKAKQENVHLRGRIDLLTRRVTELERGARFTEIL
jgi:hypothetical protein